MPQSSVGACLINFPVIMEFYFNATAVMYESYFMIDSLIVLCMSDPFPPPCARSPAAQ